MENSRINIAYISSIREIGGDELVGRRVIDQDSRVDHGYRTGSLEHLARLLQEGTHLFAEKCNLVAIFVDDNDEQWENAWKQANVWPRNLTVPYRDAGGETVYKKTLDEITFRISSTPWRKARGDDKFNMKSDYERAVTRELQKRNVDLLISDSHVSIFLDPTKHPHPEGLILEVYEGRALNVHPAITAKNDPDRLPGVTPTRDAYTRAREGWIIIDDKHAVDLPEGERIKVTYKGKEHIAVKVQKSYRTGVTVHEMIGSVDNGTVVHCRTHEFPREGLTYEGIRALNYALKNQVLAEAIIMYVEREEFQERVRTARERS